MEATVADNHIWSQAFSAAGANCGKQIGIIVLKPVKKIIKTVSWKSFLKAPSLSGFLIVIHLTISTTPGTLITSSMPAKTIFQRIICLIFMLMLKKQNFPGW